MKNPHRIVRVFDKAATTYEDWYSKPMGIYAFFSELNGLESLLPPSGLGIDIGAGTGIFAKHLSSEERTIVCLDPSSKMLKKAVEKHLMAILATAEDIPFRSKCFDFLYMVTVLEFLPDPSKALYSIGSILKHEAPIIIVFINRESSWGELYSKLAKHGDSIFSCARFYTIKDIRFFLEKTDYESIEMIGTLSSPPNEPSTEIILSQASSRTGVILIKAKKCKKADKD